MLGSRSSETRVRIVVAAASILAPVACARGIDNPLDLDQSADAGPPITVGVGTSSTVGAGAGGFGGSGAIAAGGASAVGTGGAAGAAGSTGSVTSGSAGSSGTPGAGGAGGTNIGIGGSAGAI